MGRDAAVTTDQLLRIRIRTERTGKFLVLGRAGAGKKQLIVDRVMNLLRSGLEARSFIVVLPDRAAVTLLHRAVLEEFPESTHIELRITTMEALAFSIVSQRWQALGLVDRPLMLDATAGRVLIGQLLGADDDPDGWPVDGDARRSPAFAAAVAATLERLDDPQSRPEDDPIGAFARRYVDRLDATGSADRTKLIHLAAQATADPAVVSAIGAAHVLVEGAERLDRHGLELVANLVGGASSSIVSADPSLGALPGAAPALLNDWHERAGAERIELALSRVGNPTLFHAAALLAPELSAVATTAPLSFVDIDETSNEQTAAVKSRWESEADGPPLVVGGFETRRTEAAWLVQDLVARHRAGHPWETMAIACADLATDGPLMLAALEAGGVPCRAHALTAGTTHPWVRMLDDVLLALTGRDVPSAVVDAIETLAVSPLVAANATALAGACRAARRSDDPLETLRARVASQRREVGAHVFGLLDAVRNALKADRDGHDAAEVAWVLWRGLPYAEQLSTIDEAALSTFELDGIRAINAWHAQIRTVVEAVPGATTSQWLAHRTSEPDSWRDQPMWGSGVTVTAVTGVSDRRFDHVAVMGVDRDALADSGASLLDPGLGAQERVARQRLARCVSLSTTSATMTWTATSGAGADRGLSALLADLAAQVSPFDNIPLHEAPNPHERAELLLTRIVRDHDRPILEQRAAAHGLARLASSASWVPQAPLDPAGDAGSSSSAGVAPAPDVERLERLAVCGLAADVDELIGHHGGDDQIDRAFSQSAHDAIAAWIRDGDRADEAGLLSTLQARFERDVAPIIGTAAVLSTHHRRLDRIARQVVQRIMPQIGEIIDVARDVQIPTDRGLVSATLDVIASDGSTDGYEIIDWQVGPDRQPEREAAAILLRHRLLSDRSVERPPSSVRVARVEEGRWRSLDGSLDDRADDLYVGLIEKLDRSGAPTPGAHCQRCSIQLLCPSRPEGSEVTW